MKLFSMTVLVMIAFAGNSILTRLALANNEMTPFDFAMLRALSGAAILVLILIMRRKIRPPSGVGVVSITALGVYLLGFSLAYVSIDTGTGALLLFGGVQITMFVAAYMAGETITRARMLGALLAFAGLCVLFLPISAAPDGKGTALMLAAALGWGIYSLIGRKAADPLGETAWNFIGVVPIVVIAWWLTGGVLYATPTGIWLAIASGAVTSALGYALWYWVLPHLDRSLSAVAQLTVPIIAALGGLITLGEPLSLSFLLATLLVITGVSWSIFGKR